MILWKYPVSLLNRIQVRHVLQVLPLVAGRAKEGPGALMVEPSSGLDIAGDVWVECLVFWCNPINDHSFHSFGIIRPGTISAFLNLCCTSVDQTM